MWTRADRYDPMPPLPLPGVVEDRNGAWRLRNLTEATDIRQAGAHAPLGQASVLGTVGAIEATSVVVRRRIASPGRQRAGLAVGTRVGRGTSARFFARVGRLQK